MTDLPGLSSDTEMKNRFRKSGGKKKKVISAETLSSLSSGRKVLTSARTDGNIQISEGLRYLKAPACLKLSFLRSSDHIFYFFKDSPPPFFFKRERLWNSSCNMADFLLYVMQSRGQVKRVRRIAQNSLTSQKSPLWAEPLRLIHGGSVTSRLRNHDWVFSDAIS